MDSDLEMAIICERMHWTYQEYANQPVNFLEVLKLKWTLDNEHQERMHKQNSDNVI